MELTIDRALQKINSGTWSVAMLCTLCASSTITVAQDNKKLGADVLFPVGIQLQPGAFNLAFGITHNFRPIEHPLTNAWEATDSSYSALVYPIGGTGIYLEGGWTRLLKNNPMLDMIDGGLSFKQFRGQERSEGTFAWRRATDQMDTLLLPGDGYFDQSFVSASFNVSKALQTSAEGFVLLAAGVNLDYRIFNTVSYTYDAGLNRHELPDKFLGQFHARIGYGIKLREMLVMTPTVEMPLMGTNGASRVQWFSTKYRPVIFSIRFMWMRRPSSFDCPTIKPARGEKVRKKDYRQELFHPDNARDDNSRGKQ